MKLEGIQAARAVAALLVAAFHINVFLFPQRLYNGSASWQGFNMGYSGVEFFFVLSGFIMVYVHAKDFGIPARAAQFIRKRVLRIYPFYWMVLFSISLLYFFMPGRGPEQARDPVALLTSALLWPTEQSPILEVAWTLRHEMLFYLVFVLIVLNFRIGMILFVSWQLSCLIALFFGVGAFPATFLLSPYNILFMLGMCAAAGAGRLGFSAARTVFVIGTLSFLAIGLSDALGSVDWDHGYRTVAYGVAGALIVLGLANMPLSPPRLLCFLGDASYAIYLVHLPVLVITTAIILPLGAPWGLPPLAMMVLLLAGVSAAGGLAHIAFEQPLLRMTKPRVRLAS